MAIKEEAAVTPTIREIEMKNKVFEAARDWLCSLCLATGGVRIGGVATVLVDGQQFALKGNMTVNPSVVRREGVAGQDYVHGYLENPIVPQIKGDFSTVPGLSTEFLEAMTDVTVQADLANGSTYILSQAWTVSAFVIDSVRGQLEVVFEGIYCDELVS